MYRSLRVKLVALALGVSLPLSAVPDVRDDFDLLISPPPGFAESNAFDGFQNVQAFATLQVEEFATSFSDMRATLSDEILADRGMRVVSRRSLEDRDRDTLLLRLAPVPPGLAFNQWMLVIGDSLRSLLITASYPSFTAAQLDPALEATLLSARWKRSAEEQIFYDLPFSLNETQDLKLRRRTPTMVVLGTKNASGAGAGTASLVVGYLLADGELPDLDVLARRHLLGLKGMEVLEVVTESETEVDGVAALRTVARIRALASGETQWLDQIVATQKDKYLLAQGATSEALWARYEVQFQAAFDSIRFKPANQ